MSRLIAPVIGRLPEVALAISLSAISRAEIWLGEISRAASLVVVAEASGTSRVTSGAMMGLVSVTTCGFVRLESFGPALAGISRATTGAAKLVGVVSAVGAAGAVVSGAESTGTSTAS